LTQKLKEESIKYSTLKLDEENILKEINDTNENVNNYLKEVEEKIRKVNNEIKLLTVSHLARSENINKDMLSYQEKIKILEQEQKEKKSNQDQVKFQYEYELNKLNTEQKFSGEKLTLSFLSSETLKKELEKKKKILEDLENKKEENVEPTNSNQASKIPLRSMRTSIRINQKDTTQDIFGNKKDTNEKVSKKETLASGSNLTNKKVPPELGAVIESVKEEKENLKKDSSKPMEEGKKLRPKSTVANTMRYINKPDKKIKK